MGKITQYTSFEKVFVPPAAHDAGTAIGAALYFYHHQLKEPRSSYNNQAYTGMRFSEKKIIKILYNNNITYQFFSDKNLYEEVTKCLIEGGVVGWFQGRAEFGPRALGNRSILVDPRRTDAKELLNQKIKKRESFRPFSPSILKEYVTDYFEQADEVPFMEKVFKIRKDKQRLIPAVTHIDGTGRLQTVSKADNPRYYSLIKTFLRKTGIPVFAQYFV